MNRTQKWIAAGAGAVIAVAAGTGIAFAAVDGDSDDALQGTTLHRASAAALEHTGGGRVTEAEHEDDGDGDGDEGSYQVGVTLADGSEVDVHLDSSFRVIDGPTVVDRAGTDDAAPLDAATVERIGQAALVDTPGGRVLDLDVDDDTGTYEVEVLRSDGTVVDIILDRDLRVTARVPDLDRDDAP